MADHASGQVDTTAAEVYDNLFVPALFGRFSEPIANVAGVRSDDDVLDVACGTGALTRTVRAATTGTVVGVDLNPGMLAVAARHGGPIDYREADAAALPFDDGAFDLAVCQFGLMFLPDPVAGLRELARVADRGLVAVWDSIDGSDGYLAMQAMFRRELGDDAAASLDAPFSMGAAGVLDGLVGDADLGDVEYHRIEGTGRFDSIEQWVTTEVRGWTLGETVSDEQLAQLVATAERDLAAFSTDDGCVFGMTALAATW